MGLQILKLKWLLILLVLTLQMAVTAISAIWATSARCRGLTCCEERGLYTYTPSITDGCEKTCEIKLTPEEVKENRYKAVCSSYRFERELETNNVTNIPSTRSPSSFSSSPSPPSDYEYVYYKSCSRMPITRTTVPSCSMSMTDRSIGCDCNTNLCNKIVKWSDGERNKVDGTKNSGHGRGGGLTSVLVVVTAAAAAVFTGLGRRRHYNLIC